MLVWHPLGLLHKPNKNGNFSTCNALFGCKAFSICFFSSVGSWLRKAADVTDRSSFDFIFHWWILRMFIRLSVVNVGKLCCDSYLFLFATTSSWHFRVKNTKIVWTIETIFNVNKNLNEFRSLLINISLESKRKFNDHHVTTHFLFQFQLDLTLKYIQWGRFCTCNLIDKLTL